jgi:ABC-type sulfate transport system permease component
MDQEMIHRRLFISCALCVLLLYASLILSLLYFFRLPVLEQSLFSARTLFSIRLSLTAATAAALLSVAVGIPAAYALSRYDFPGKRWVDTMLEFPWWSPLPRWGRSF